MVTAPARDRALLVLALAFGMIGWWGTSMLAGRREAWDAPIYGQLTLPLTCLVLGLFGYFGSRAAWRWPLLVFGAQLATMIARNGGVGTLLPLGFVLFLVLAIVGLLPTYLGVGLRRARQRRLAARVATDARRANLGAEADDAR